jgi:hypothetical protein
MKENESNVILRDPEDVCIAAGLAMIQCIFILPFAFDSNIRFERQQFTWWMFRDTKNFDLSWQTLRQ